MARFVGWNGPAPQTSPKRARKHLSADALYGVLRARFEQFHDARGDGVSLSLADVAFSALAMFLLKDPSLLAFDARRHDRNLKNVFGIQRVPSDTQMREVLDELDPLQMRAAFNDVFRQLQRGKVLESFVFHEGSYLIAMDGTGYFSSQKVHCDACLQKVNSTTGEITYSHQMLGACLVHPDRREVIPLAPEPIVKADGQVKNDCERNAARRLLQRIREEHPHLQLIVIEDGLASNAPHIRDLQRLGMHFILGCKPGDHEFLYARLVDVINEHGEQTLEWKDGDTRCQILFINHVQLNESSPDVVVNFIMYAEYGPDGTELTKFSWVTDLLVTMSNARKLTRGGRSRWKIENETFNTLKNQGYHYEHNFGHGRKHLSVVFAMLMMLAFLVDQVQQICCPLFRAVWEKYGSKRALWEKLRSHFEHFLFSSMRHIYEVMLHDLAKEVALPILNSS